MLRYALVTALLLAIMGCRDSTGPSGPNIDGTWTGTVLHLTFTMELTAGTGGPITGTGEMLAGTTSVPMTVSDTYSYPSITFVGAFEEFLPITFEGTVSNSNPINVALSGSGFRGAAMTLQRQ